MKPNPAIISPVLNHYAPRVIALGVLALLLLFWLARSHAQTVANPAGVYQLVSVDGKDVPCTIKHGGTAMYVHSGTFTISTNGQVASVMTVSMGDKRNIRVERQATYTVKESELTMKWQNAGTTKGRVAGQTFTMTNEGMVYIYKK